MAQHFVLVSVVPPLMVLGSPSVPLLRGLPRWFIRYVVARVLRLTVFHRLGALLVDLRVAWITMNAAYIGWHIPKAYELALSSEHWHNLEHLCFLVSSILFWWPIIQPWPSRQLGSRWVMIPYLLSADIVNTAVPLRFAFRAICFIQATQRLSGRWEPTRFPIRSPPEHSCGSSARWSSWSRFQSLPCACWRDGLQSPQCRLRCQARDETNVYSGNRHRMSSPFRMQCRYPLNKRSFHRIRAHHQH
jgi:hypothetical protein